VIPNNNNFDRNTPPPRPMPVISAPAAWARNCAVLSTLAGAGRFHPNPALSPNRSIARSADTQRADVAVRGTGLPQTSNLEMETKPPTPWPVTAPHEPAQSSGLSMP
jgi:hypothetical protein